MKEKGEGEVGPVERTKQRAGGRRKQDGDVS